MTGRPTTRVVVRMVLVLALVSVYPSSTGDAHPAGMETPGAHDDGLGVARIGPFVCEIEPTVWRLLAVGDAPETPVIPSNRGP